MADAQVKQQLQDAFQAIDKDGSGFIDCKEVAEVLRKFAADSKETPDEAKIHHEAEEFLAKADKDKDHKVSLQEFLDFYSPRLGKK